MADLSSNIAAAGGNPAPAGYSGRGTMTMQTLGQGVLPNGAATGTASLDNILGSSVGSALQTGAAAYGAQNSAEDITKGINAGITTQQQTLGNVNSLYATQQQTGNAADTQLQSALGLNGHTMDPNLLAGTPGYQFAVSQGLNAVRSAAAANGSAYTPNTLTNVGQTVTGLADQNYNNYVQNLLSTAGLGAQANSTLAGANLSTGGNISQLQQNSGVAQGAGVSGVSNDVSSLLGSLNSSGVLSSAAGGLGNVAGSIANGLGNVAGSIANGISGAFGGTGTPGSMTQTQLNNLTGNINPSTTPNNDPQATESNADLANQYGFGDSGTADTTGVTDGGSEYDSAYFS